MQLNPVRIDINEHALERIEQRCSGWPILSWEGMARVRDTVLTGRICQTRHRSRKHKVFVKYYSDGLCFYVICEEKQNHKGARIRVLTVIIEEGRP
ncbi:MAG: hypothetical protein AABX47_02740 [Nanoarchaeota archaeon]